MFMVVPTQNLQARGKGSNSQSEKWQTDMLWNRQVFNTLSDLVASFISLTTSIPIALGSYVFIQIIIIGLSKKKKL